MPTLLAAYGRVATDEFRHRVTAATAQIALGLLQAPPAEADTNRLAKLTWARRALDDAPRAANALLWCVALCVPVDEPLTDAAIIACITEELTTLASADTVISAGGLSLP